MVGKTKAGATTVLHYLCNNVLEGSYNDVQNVVYKLKEMNDKKYDNMKIGDKENISEICLPNVV